MNTHLITIATCALLAPLAHAGNSPVQELTLDPAKPVEIPVGAKTATTLQFPRPLQGIFGYGLTEGQAPGSYHYAHPSGSRLLSLRNLLPGKDTFVTVLLGEEDLYVLHLQAAADPPVAVRLRDPADEDAAWRAHPIAAEDAAARKLDHDTARLFHLLKLGKNERVFRNVLPHLFDDVETRQVDYRHDDGEVATVVTKLHRFPAEDTVFLFAEIENKTDEAKYFDPGSLQVKAGSRTYPVALVDSAAVIAAKGKIPLHVMIRGGVEGERAHLSIKNEFRLIMPAYSASPDDPGQIDQAGWVADDFDPDKPSQEGPSSGLLPDWIGPQSGPSDGLFPEPSLLKDRSPEGGAK